MRTLDFALTVAITIAFATAFTIVHSDWHAPSGKPKPNAASRPLRHVATHPAPGTLALMGESARPDAGPQAAPVWIEIADSGTANGSAAAFDADPAVPFHYVIGNGRGAPDGGVEASARGTAMVLDAEDPRLRICLVGDFDAGEPTPAQKAALVELCARLCAEHGVPPERVVGVAKREGLSIAWLRDRLRP